ncbi:MAG: hypothetical protein JJU03_05785 [Idiomarina sp.]|nr:hypothetical protein [Idiomarina sp.]
MPQHDFEQAMLMRLHQQYPVLNNLNGSVIFRTDASSKSPNFIAWAFNENAEAYLRELGLKDKITHIIEQLIGNRMRNTVMPVCAGVIEFMQGQFMIEWRSQPG